MEFNEWSGEGVRGAAMIPPPATRSKTCLPVRLRRTGGGMMRSPSRAGGAYSAEASASAAKVGTCRGIKRSNRWSPRKLQ